MRDPNVDDWAKWKELKPNAVPSILATKIVSRTVVNHQATWQNLILLLCLGSQEWFSILWSMYKCLHGTLERNKAISGDSHLSMWNFSDGGTHSGPWTVLLSVPGWSSPAYATSYGKTILKDYILWWFNIGIGGKKLCVPQILSSMWPL